jgi:hypothetical protein
MSQMKTGCGMNIATTHIRKLITRKLIDIIRKEKTKDNHEKKYKK